MAFRSEKAAAGLIVASLALAATTNHVRAEDLQFEVRHARLLKDHRGVLAFDAAGVSYRQMDAKKSEEQLERHRWEYPDIQELRVAPGRVLIVTYRDRKWLFGVDREFEFFAVPGQGFEKAYTALKEKLDQRLVAALADTPEEILWSVPVKLTGPVRGAEGVLAVGRERIVFRTEKKEQSRTWRYRDVESISSSGLFDLTLVTWERSRTHYGSRRSFSFQLKQPLDENRYDRLWKEVAGLGR